MSNSNPDPQAAFALFRMANGYIAAQALYVAADLGIADYLTQGALTAQELASKTGSHPDALARLLRALVAFGILNSDADDRFTLTPLGEFLRSDVPASASILTATEMVGDPAIRLRLVQIVGSNFLDERNPIGIRRPKAMPANSAGSLFNLDSTVAPTPGGCKRELRGPRLSPTTNALVSER
jgi:Dimerisation domain